MKPGVAILENIKERYDKYVYGQSGLNIFTLSAFHADKILLFQMLGPKDLAIYSFSTIVVDRLRGILKSIGQIAYPKFVKGETGNLKNRLNSNLLFSVFALSVLFILCLLFLPFIYKYLLPQYYPHYKYALLYSVSIFSVLAIIPYTLMQAKNMTQPLFKYEILNSVAQVLFVYIGIHLGGLAGAIIGKSLASLFNTASVYILLKISR
jgi:O-antigen/teichoic acid export membrane protein